MYAKILLALDASPTDEVIINHIVKLAKCHNSNVVLFRVVHSHTRDSNTHEVAESRAYLEGVAERFSIEGISVEIVLAFGEPAEQIIQQANEMCVELIAMGTHGHKGLYDTLFGSVSDEVRHAVSIPMLLIKAGE